MMTVASAQIALHLSAPRKALARSRLPGSNVKAHKFLFQAMFAHRCSSFLLSRDLFAAVLLSILYAQALFCQQIRTSLAILAN